MRLKPQTEKQVQEMVKAGYPICLSKGDWSGKYRRHCNACIKQYKRRKEGVKFIV